MRKLKDDLHLELKRAFAAVCQRNSVRREFVDEEDVAKEMVPWLEAKIEEAIEDFVKASEKGQNWR